MSDLDHLTFENPPIVEVVAAVAFEPLPASALVHFGAFWKQELAGSFPRIEEKPPYVPQIERFGSEVFAPQFNFIAESDYPSPRLWALNDAGDEVLQLQRNWFACNWRKVTAGSAYTHWPARKQTFARWYSALDAYLAETGVGRLSATQCEVTYINHVVSGGVWKRHGEISKIFRAISDAETPAYLERESTRFGQDYLIHDDAGRSVGRLHISAQPAFRSEDRTPIYVFEMTARGVPTSKDVEGVSDFLDLGRNTIVSTFAAITSDEMQREWGKQ